MQAPCFLSLTAMVVNAVSASWLPVYDNNGSPVCTVGGTLQCAGQECECVGTAPTVVPPPCDTTLESQVPDCYSRCRDSDGACITYFTCPAGFSKSDMIWTCESGRLASLLGYDYQENIKLLAEKSYSRVITSSTYDDGETWTPSCHSPGPSNYAVGYQTCYTLDPNVGAPTTTTTTTTTWGIPTVWENVGEPGKSACRGHHVNDNDPNHYTVRAAQSLEDCKVLCSQQPSCKGIEYSVGRCEIWTRPQGIYISKVLDGFTCLRYGRDISRLVKYEGGDKDYACRYQDPNDNSPSFYKVSSPPCLVLSDCKARCAAADVCYGIEFSKGRCEIWLLPIRAAKEIAGFECWIYPGATKTYEPNVLALTCMITLRMNLHPGLVNETLQHGTCLKVPFTVVGF